MSIAFAGAVLAYLAAKYFFGATGLNDAQRWVFAGLIFSLAINGLMRLKKKDVAHG